MSEAHEPEVRAPSASADGDGLVQERAALRELRGRPFYVRWAGYARQTGPGWLQSAMTLGGGTAVSSLTIGAYFGYDLLWLQPLAMALGIIMLTAISYQTLSTGARPFDAMRRHGLGAFAWAWAVASLLATLIWHFPQYALTAGMTEDMVHALTGWQATGPGRTAFLLIVGLLVVAVSTWVTWSYAGGRRGIRWYERALKLMVWLIIVAFAVVIARATLAGRMNWKDVLLGFLPLRIPTDPKGVEMVMSAFGAAVGINMTFMFPYTLLARGWRDEHWGLSIFDLVTGMFLPFLVATSLMVMAAACTIHGTLSISDKIQPVDAARMIAGAGVGSLTGHVVFGLGVIGMTLSSITTHMLVSGFALCEILGWPQTGWKYKLACLFPVPGFLGVVVWKYMGLWIAIRASAICGLFLPIAYVAFLIMHNKKAYLGDRKPAGRSAVAWNLGMGLAIAATLASIIYFLASNWNKILGAR